MFALSRTQAQNAELHVVGQALGVVAQGGAHVGDGLRHVQAAGRVVRNDDLAAVGRSVGQSHHAPLHSMPACTHDEVHADKGGGEARRVDVERRQHSAVEAHVGHHRKSRRRDGREAGVGVALHQGRRSDRRCSTE